MEFHSYETLPDPQPDSLWGETRGAVQHLWERAGLALGSGGGKLLTLGLRCGRRRLAEEQRRSRYAGSGGHQAHTMYLRGH